MSATDLLWQRYCDRFNRSRAYRPLDEAPVAIAYSDWLASYLQDAKAVDKSNVIQFQPRGSE